MAIIGVTFQEMKGFVEDEAFSDMSWDAFLAHVLSGADNVSVVNIWSDMFTDDSRAIRMYIEVTPKNNRFIVYGAYLDPQEGEWYEMSDEATADWMTTMGIPATPIYSGGLAVTLDGLSKLPGAVASMKKGFVKEVVGSL